MAEIITYRVTIDPMGAGATFGIDTIHRGVTKPEGRHVHVTIAPSSVQMVGLENYLVLIRSGVDTSTVQTAINALSP